MAVMLECISVVVPKAKIEAKYPGGLVQYVADCPNGTFSCDRQLTRVGFMGPGDVSNFIRSLEMKGLRFQKRGKCEDFVVIDTVGGPTAPCDWIEFQNMTFRGGLVVRPYCWLKGTKPGKVVKVGRRCKLPGQNDERREPHDRSKS